MSGENDVGEIKTIPGIPDQEKAAAEARETDKSASEARQLTSGLSEKDLRDKAKRRDHERSEYFKDHFERITVIGLYLMALGVFLFAAIWVHHMLAPLSWHWLDNEQISRIQNIVTGGVLAGMIAEQFRRRLGGPN